LQGKPVGTAPTDAHLDTSNTHNMAVFPMVKQSPGSLSGAKSSEWIINQSARKSRLEKTFHAPATSAENG